MLGHPIGRTYTPTETPASIARRVWSEDAKAQTQKTVETILQAGQLVDGKYRVEHLLGEGGMAAVWAGTNERTGKRVALKVILRSLATTPAAQGLFHSEALASSRVNHPNVVTVFDVMNMRAWLHRDGTARRGAARQLHHPQGIPQRRRGGGASLARDAWGGRRSARRV